MVATSNGDNFYLEAPESANEEQMALIKRRSIFLYGRITGCESWQPKAKAKLGLAPDLFVLNPRRQNYSSNDPETAAIQIEWEYRYSALATQKLFWFTKDTIQPITLYELGKELAFYKAATAEGLTTKPIFIGVDPLYGRVWDIIHQTRLIAPDLPIYFNLSGMIDAIINYNIVNVALQKKT